jgi:hypothetical protein
MKTFLAFGLISFSGLISVRADIPAPKPVSIIVSNVSAFPLFKFSYRSDEGKGAKSIVDGQSFKALADVALLVQSGDEPPQSWETVKYDWRGANVAIRVEGVKREGRQITVTYKTSGGAAPTKKTAAAGWQAAPWFALAGTSVCALVVIARRRGGRATSH